MILHRLVQIHNLQHRRVKAGQKLTGHDHDLQRVIGIAEIVQNLGFLIAAAAPLLVLIRLIVIGIHDNRGDRLTQQPVQFFFIQNTAFAVIANHLRLEAVGVHLGHEMLCNVLTDGTNSLRILHDCRHADFASDF